MNAPQSLPELLREFADIQQDISFLRALRGLRVATVNGDISWNYTPGSDNLALDLRSLSPTATPVANNIPSQFGNSTKFLTTDGATMSWASPANLFTYVTRAATQTLSNATDTAVSFDTANVNTSAVWSVSNPTRLTPPSGQAGIWMFSGWMQYFNNSTSSRFAYWRRNDGSIFGVDSRTADTTGLGMYCHSTTFFPIAEGGYAEFYGKQYSGGNLNVVGAEIVACRIGATP